MARDRKYFGPVRNHQEILRNTSEILDDLDFIHHEYASGQDKILPAAE
jgi:hypothetical protein